MIVNNKKYIWNEIIPYNTGEKKFEDSVELWSREELFKRMGAYFAVGEDPNRDPLIRRQIIEIDETGKWGAKHTMEDAPYLLSYLVPGSDRAVIIVPGGAYVMKSMEHEGTEVAELLNKEGISCFVLWYRTYPYQYPVPYMDLQRAIRYVRYHAADFGLNPAKIGLLGFSAGGNCCAGQMNIIRNQSLWEKDYKADDVDRTDAGIALAGLMYPALDVREDEQCLKMLVGEDIILDEKEKQHWTDYFHMASHIKKGDAPQYLCYGSEDNVVNPVYTKEYYSKLKKCGIETELVELKGVDHGFGSCVNPHREAEKLAQNWQIDFASWANRIFDRL